MPALEGFEPQKIKRIQVQSTKSNSRKALLKTKKEIL